MKMELRVNPASIATNEDGTMTVEGYVNKTEKRSNMLGRTQKFVEVIKRGAWQRALDRAKEIHFLAEHDNSKILASTRNSSLELYEDEEGLYMRATICPTSWGKDYYQLIKDGILQNMSFGFRAIKDSWRNMGDYFERTVSDLELFEVSVVRDPAYSQSTISARGIDLVEDEVPEEVRNEQLKNEVKYEIRSDEDIEKIAKKLFEMIKNDVKIAEGHEDEVKQQTKQQTEAQESKEEKTENVVDEGKTDEVKDEQPVVEDKADEKPQDEQKTEEQKTDEVPDEQKVKNEQVDENTEEDTNKKTAEKIREFINKYKQQ
jgi:HK97 family phage prohead protease